MTRDPQRRERTADVGIIATDEHGLIEFASLSASVALHLNEPLVGRRVQDVLALTAGPERLAAGAGERRWIQGLRAGDDAIEVDLTLTHGYASARGGSGYLFVLRDLALEKILEIERQRLERLAAMGTMVAGFAHEIRNPMASLRSIAEALGEELMEAGVNLPHVARMLDVLERVERLVRSSLLFGRPSPPRPALHRPVDIVSTAIQTLAPRTRELGGTIRFEASAVLPSVFVDDGQIVQVLVVLLNNAIDATGDPSRVRIRAHYGHSDGPGRSEPPPSFFVRLEVCDDGPGIPAHIEGRVFDPFFTTKASGTGLGLSIAQQLVAENHGRLELTTAAGGPTQFCVSVPLGPRDEPPPSSRPA